MKLNELLDGLEKMRLKQKELQDEVDRINSEIDAIISDPIRNFRLETNKPFGTVNVMVDGIIVKHVIPKTVQWDQGRLAGIHQLISESGDDADKYMASEMKYSVSEKLFDAFPDAVKKVFEPARTVKFGSPRITFERKEEKSK